VTYEEALAAIFIEALIFIFISLIGLRGRLIELVPKHIMLATAVGIGECLVLPVGLPGNSLLMLCDRCWLWL
jgi:AGZA family xanthine/uracil permease-like MFS transporter